MINTLFNEFALNDTLKLKNKILMAPMTRCMSGNLGIPGQNVVDYYQRRSDVGLIISEGSIVDPMGNGYPGAPGIYTAEQTNAWKAVTKAVHEKNGLFFMQLWHVGRVSHPSYLNGQKPWGPSAVALSGDIPRSGGLRYGETQEMSVENIEHTIKAFATGARNAMDAGCDGVEIHGANGYIIDQFLRAHTNRREDDYGGSFEKRMRFALEIVDAVIAEIGSDRCGIRLSPGAYFNMTHTPGDEEVFKLLLSELETRKLAYVHVGIFDDSMEFPYLKGRASAFLRNNYKGTLVGCGSYTPEAAATAIEEKNFDLIAIGRPLIANPDFVTKLKNGGELKAYDAAMLADLF
ncbi:alkene reductase [bacterium]|nr:alkene reductase [bacterium]